MTAILFADAINVLLVLRVIVNSDSQTFIIWHTFNVWICLFEVYTQCFIFVFARSTTEQHALCFTMIRRKFTWAEQLLSRHRLPFNPSWKRATSRPITTIAVSYAYRKGNPPSKQSGSHKCGIWTAGNQFAVTTAMLGFVCTDLFLIAFH